MSEDLNVLAESLSGDNEDVENGGVGPGDAEEQGVAQEDQAFTNEDDPLSVKKRLGMQAKKHSREMRALRDQMAQMQAMMSSDSASPHTSTYQTDPYSSPGQPSAPAMSEQDKIQQAVRMALGFQQQEQERAEEEKRRAHVDKQYQNLHEEFDKASEIYDDFDDVVRGNDVPFTKHVRDALLLIGNPADVAYRLGKNRSELERISKLHPIDQAKEVIKLGTSLLGGGSNKTSSSKSAPLGSVRANPGNTSRAVTDKMPTSEIRRRMKSGDWK
jgi:hypothetical protein